MPSPAANPRCPDNLSRLNDRISKAKEAESSNSNRPTKRAPLGPVSSSSSAADPGNPSIGELLFGALPDSAAAPKSKTSANGGKRKAQKNAEPSEAPRAKEKAKERRAMTNAAAHRKSL